MPKPLTATNKRIYDATVAAYRPGMPLDKGGLYDVVRAQFPELNDHSFYRRWAAVHYAAQCNEVFEWDTERGVADDPANIPNLPPRVPVAEAARRLDDDLVWPAGTTRTIGALGKNANLRTVDVYDAIWDVLREDGRAISEGYAGGARVRVANQAVPPRTVGGSPSRRRMPSSGRSRPAASRGGRRHVKPTSCAPTSTT